MALTSDGLIIYNLSIWDFESWVSYSVQAIRILGIQVTSRYWTIGNSSRALNLSNYGEGSKFQCEKSSKGIFHVTKYAWKPNINAFSSHITSLLKNFSAFPNNCNRLILLKSENREIWNGSKTYYNLIIKFWFSCLNYHMIILLRWLFALKFVKSLKWYRESSFMKNYNLSTISYCLYMIYKLDGNNWNIGYDSISHILLSCWNVESGNAIIKHVCLYSCLFLYIIDSNRLTNSISV